MRQETVDTCEHYKRQLARGADPSEIVSALATIYGVGRHAVWMRLRRGGLIAPLRKRGPQGKRAKRRSIMEIKQEAELAPRIDRDPCIRCGVRADIGCKHSRAPVGMIFSC